MAKKPLWIAITGLYGAGKTKLVNNLEEWLIEEGLKVARFELPFHCDRLLKKIEQSYDIQADRLLMAYYNRIIANQIQELYGSCDVVLTEGSLLDLYVYSAMHNIDYMDTSNIQKINEKMLIEDVVLFLDAEMDIAFSRIYQKEQFKKLKSKSYLQRQSIEIKNICDALKTNNGFEMYSNAKIYYLDTTVNTPRLSLKLAKEFIKNCQ